jgi:hypothetical protein
MSDQYPPPGSYPPPGGGGYQPPGGDQPQYGQQPQYGPPSSGAPYGQQPTSGNPYDQQQPPAYGQPPTSGNPYDQQPPPYGQQPPQYGQQPPGPPGYGPPGAPPFGAPPPPPKKSNVGKIIAIIAGVLVLLCVLCGVFGWNKIKDAIDSSSTNAKVGDCLAGDSISDETSKDVSVHIVKCDATDAKYKVIGIKSGVSQSESLKDETTVCEAFTASKYVLWQGKNLSSGDALCLDDAK